MAEIRGDGTIMRTLTKICSLILAFSLLLGAFFAPLLAQAGFFSSFLGDEAYAETQAVDEQTNTPDVLKSTKNSQTLALLQSNVSPLSILQDSKGSRQGGTYGAGKKDNKGGEIDLNANINILSDNALVPAARPLAMGGPQEEFSSDQISVYVVRKGDTVGQIADMFSVSVNTILSANDMKKNDKLQEGEVLFILPISGIEHTVTKGQTLKSIAKLYKTEIDDIAFYNGIAEDAKLVIGDKLMIPGADNMADEGGDKPASNLSGAVARDQNYYALHPIQNLVGYFINPLPTGHKTQGLHGPGHRGIDIGAPTGTPIYASANGKVLAIKTGCKVGQRFCGGGYGNMTIVEHPNGTRTLYAHMSKLATKSGAQVSQGEIIGYVGNTGKSTGPHIHFEVFNAKNPGADWSWAN